MARTHDTDDGNPILFQVPEDVHNTLTSWGYDLDEAETTADCAGYSAFIEQGGREFYSFAVLDRRNDQDDLDPDGRLAFQCYVTHEDFHVLAEGDYYGTKADGINHLTVGSQSVDTDQIQHVLERLFEAVRTFSKEHPADA